MRRYRYKKPRTCFFIFIFIFLFLILAGCVFYFLCFWPGLKIDQVANEEREKTGIWCVKESNDCFYFDKEGIVFHPAPLMISSLTLSIFSSEQSIPSLGAKVLNSEDLEKILQIKNLSKEKANLDLVSLENYLPNGHDFEFISKAGWRVFFNAKANLEQQIHVLIQTLEKEIGEKQADLEYLDLRVKNRAYYKLKE